MKPLSDRALDRLRLEAALPDLEGTRYRMVRPVGSGGMGEVFLVEDVELSRRVAMKVLTGIDPSDELTRRMLREARIVAQLEHPGIVPVHDVGTLPDGRAYFTMKFVGGARLDHHAGALLSLPEKLRLFHKVCEAVAFAHVHGVLHRDLKPENIMVGPFGEVLVMDWGIAKRREEIGNMRDEIGDRRDEIGDRRDEIGDRRDEIGDRRDEIGGRRDGEDERGDGRDDRFVVDVRGGYEGGGEGRGGIGGGATGEGMTGDGATGEGATGEGTVLGTPSYMAPEQARGAIEEIDERSDIYGLGGILYFLLTGAAPRCERDQLQSPRVLVPSIPRAVEAICLKAMAPAPDARYADAGTLASDILRHLDGHPVSAYRENPFELAARWMGKNRFVLLLIVAYLIMRLVVFLVSR